MKKSKVMWIVIGIIITIFTMFGIIASIISFSGDNNIHIVPSNNDEFVVKKPIIYLYPEETMNIQVKLGYSSKLTYTYPKYNDGWNVIASPNGDLIDINTNNKLYALYWEGSNDTTNDNNNDGFIVKGEDVASFLEDKLEYLGLNYKEKNEFIIYWLPKLENNKYNYIRFKNIDEINRYMPIYIYPEPDTIIRVIMEYKKLDSIDGLDIKEQVLTPVTRSGYTVVEWGGSEIK